MDYSFIERYILENKEKFYRIAYNYVRNKEDALDIVQESILKALKNKKSLQSAEAVNTWFYRIIINTSTDFIRKNRKIIYITDEFLENRGDFAEDTYTNFELQDALDKLPDKYKSIIILRFFEDLKIEDIAVILDENVNSVKTKLYTALKKLRLLLESNINFS